MRSIKLCLLAIGAAAVSISASPLAVLQGPSGGDADALQARGTHGLGFQDYVIPAGPTGVDLAGALNEIQGYGVRLFSPVLVLRFLRIAYASQADELRTSPII